MKFAYLRDGNEEKKISIEDYEESMKGKVYCPDGHQMVAKRGEVVTHHFAHGQGVDCDCGGGPMSSWHLSFQNRAINEVQEIRCKVNGKLHIADTLTKSGYVIEYQHSPMKQDVMRQRESFYTGLGHVLIWVFDCSPQGCNWGFNILKRNGNEITLKKRTGNDFPLYGAYEGKVQKILDFGRKELFLVTNQKGKDLTGKLLSLKEFDKTYIGYDMSPNNDYRVFHHQL